MKFVIIGHVDHGKSTCAGRILVDTNSVSPNEISEARREAEINNRKDWLSYLLDTGEERVRGKTHEHIMIDISYQGRIITLVDVPGHRNYVPEMVAGCCNADVALLICSAKRGEYESGLKGQTLEHILIAKTMGVDNLLIGINKMDHGTVNWNKDIYKSIVDKITAITRKIKFNSVDFVPISAHNGDNIIYSRQDRSNTDNTLLDKLSKYPLKYNLEPVLFSTKNIRAKCMFIYIESIITIGFSCMLHSMNNMTECCIINILHKPKFIRPVNIQAHIEIILELSEEIDVYSRILLRAGDRTIGMGCLIID